MDLGIDKNKAEEMVAKYVTEPTTKLHLLESEAIMKAVAMYVYKDDEPAVAEAMVDKWGIIGLLHDIDWDVVKKNPLEHCIKAQEILRENGATEEMIHTIISHGFGNDAMPLLKDKQRTAKIEYCLAASETLTGLIFASALMQPEKKLASLSLKSLKKKFKSRGFAANCNREIILECEKAGIPLDEFLKIGLKSMQSISDELGL